MINANEDLPYEQQMLRILRSYDRIVAENSRLRRELADSEERSKGEIKYLRDECLKKNGKLEWVQAQLTEYLKSQGVEIPKHPTITSITKLITKN